mmetsp:Transcript_4162/g.13535  ORF Transcript_4162/g.13535 Transcript_4162/m.13535 type:complete len:223 (+) Transcript_4162:204-872(+)
MAARSASATSARLQQRCAACSSVASTWVRTSATDCGVTVVFHSTLLVNQRPSTSLDDRTDRTIDGRSSGVSASDATTLLACLAAATIASHPAASCRATSVQPAGAHAASAAAAPTNIHPVDISCLPSIRANVAVSRAKATPYTFTPPTCARANFLASSSSRVHPATKAARGAGGDVGATSGAFGWRLARTRSTADVRRPGKPKMSGWQAHHHTSDSFGVRVR